MRRCWLMAQKEIRLQLRDRSGLAIMTIFPIVLILVLGFSLKSMFETNRGPVQISGIYTMENEGASNDAFTEWFVTTAVPESEKIGLSLVPVQKEDAESMVVQRETDVWVHVDADGLRLLTNDGNAMNGEIAGLMLKSMTDSYNAVSAIAATNPEALPLLASGRVDATAAVREVPLEATRSPGALDYYAVASLTMILMYSSMSALSAITEERTNRTISRLHVTPISKAGILAGKMTGVFLVTVLQAGVVFAFSRFVLGTEWGSDFWPILLVILAQIFMCIGVGTALGHLFREPGAGIGLLSAVIPVLVFLGGGYVNLDLYGAGKTLQTLMNLSPVRWINQTILDIIYAGSRDKLPITLVICLGTGLVFLAISALAAKREVAV